MPNIEVIPNAKEAKTPGWAYVADSGLDPSKAAIVPSGARQRARLNYANETATPVLAPAEVTSREQNRINRRLVDLEKENHRDVKIEVPGKPKDVAQWSIRPGHKMTLAVKKILGSQKTWNNYLEDEEARLAQSRGRPSLQTQDSSRTTAAGDKGKKAAMPPPAAKPKQGSTGPGAEVMDLDSLPDATSEMPAAVKDDLPADIRELIRTDVPQMPSAEEIEALLSAPPLSYNQARAGPSTSSAPSRQFCDMCGFWGRVRCMKCGVRVCALDCLKAHEDTKCSKFYA